MTTADWVAAEPLPPQWSEPEKAFRVNRYADIGLVLRHPDLQVVELTAEIAKLAARTGRSFPNLINMLGGVLFFRNPPAQTKIRRFLRRSLDAFAADLSTSAIRQHVDFLLQTIPVDEPVDAVAAISARLPVVVMARALGVPERLVVEVRSISNRLIEAWHRGVPLKKYEQLEVEARNLAAILIESIRAQEGQKNGLGQMAAIGKTEFDGDNHVIAACAYFFILAAVETTAALLGNAIYLLASHPAELKRLRSAPEMMGSCLDEIMRFAGPLRRLSARVNRSGFHLGGTDVDPGTMIIAMIEQAHRDPAAYPNPSLFDIGRRAPPHFGFGAGIHACLGSVLARLEAATLVGTLFDRFEVELLDAAPQWEDNPDFRRLISLNVVLRRAATG